MAATTKKQSDKKYNTLVIVESPAKSKTIAKYLGDGFIVRASKGHVADLPKSGLGVDVTKKFAVEYAITPGREPILKEMKKLIKDKHINRVLIASDPDREGEAIGWHVANRLGLIDLQGKSKNAGIELERISFTEITKSAVQDALNSPRKLDKDLFAAQQSRRVLDRLVGYELSPLLWKKIRFGLSAGRVQSVAVKQIVDREDDRSKFKPEEYWKIFAILSVKNTNSKASLRLIEIANREQIKDLKKDEYLFELVKIAGKKAEVGNSVKVKDLESKLHKISWTITDAEEKETFRHPKPPFTTSTLQQVAANWLGYSAKKTMTVAQKLYEAGLITYMRTDSTNMSMQAVEQIRQMLVKDYGAGSVPSTARVFATKSKVAQEAHEAIRAADVLLTPEKSKLEGEQLSLYKLIWQRAVATQMQPAKIAAVSFSIVDQGLEFKISGQRLIEPGYLKVYPEKFNEFDVSALKKDMKLDLKDLYSTQHFTEPPARFSEATLIKELEKNGIGRPSTYAAIISTIQARQYATKDGGYFTPTDTGVVVTRLLATHFPKIVDLKFTAKMEDDLDSIANGEVKYLDFIDDFYHPFSKDLKAKEKGITRDDFTVLGEAPKDIICPECGGKMEIKLGKYGRFYSCKKFPDCKGMVSIIVEGDGIIVTKEEGKAPEVDLSAYEPAPMTEDKREYLLKPGRFGKFWAHPDYPKVKDAKPLELKHSKIVELYGKPPKTKDNRDFLFKTGRFGKFWAHPDYPKVKETVKIPKKPKAETAE